MNKKRRDLNPQHAFATLPLSYLSLKNIYRGEFLNES
jgi:hypothetical protein